VGARGSAEHLISICVRPAALTPALSQREREREQEAQRLLSREHREQEALLLR
jgi:ribose 1,5-bisphosphokinase PhnN